MWVEGVDFEGYGDFSVGDKRVAIAFEKHFTDDISGKDVEAFKFRCFYKVSQENSSALVFHLYGKCYNMFFCFSDLFDGFFYLGKPVCDKNIRCNLAGDGGRYWIELFYK